MTTLGLGRFSCLLNLVQKSEILSEYKWLIRPRLVLTASPIDIEPNFTLCHYGIPNSKRLNDIVKHR